MYCEMINPRADQRSAAGIYGKWSSILMFFFLVVDGAKRRDIMVLVEIMIVIVIFFWGDIRILIQIKAFPIIYSGLINSSEL